jgi:hypothetical protein
VDAPAERLARAENVGSNICVSVCCLMWGRTFSARANLSAGAAKDMMT